MNFKEFTTILKEAKFRETPPELIKQVKKLTELYINQYSSINKDSVKDLIKKGKILEFNKNKFYRPYFEHFLKEDDEDPTPVEMPDYFAPKFGSLTVMDLETNEKEKIQVMCVYGDVTEAWAAYSDNFHTINLYDENLKSLSPALIESKILHEATHAFQQYKGVSGRYTKKSDSGEDLDVENYYKRPIEYDSHLNEIVYNIRQKFNMLVTSIKKAKEDATKRVLQNRLDLFLQELKVLIKADPESYFKLKELTLPSYLQNFENFLETIKGESSDKSPLWKKFKLKMVNLYNELSSENL
jgi:hypothetical protein